ncbi:MAG TPA: AI-2E family transporter [Burkholderiaceae bacterium]|nr:AI-2E family transporter [Burkholderiaceae bacterium]
MPTLREAASPGRSMSIVAGAAVLAVLYFAREILVPITLAFLLSLLLAPLVRRLRRLGLGQVGGALVAVAMVFVLLAAAGGLIVAQGRAMGRSLPQYEVQVREKVRTIEAATIGRVESMTGAAKHVMAPLVEPGANPPPATALPLTESGAVPVEIRAPPPTAIQLVSRVSSSIWGPLGKAAIVFVVLLFTLLEHDTLRDRFIRLAGAAELRSTTEALDDAGSRLSRFFVSQLAVNAGVGLACGVGLAILHVPQAPLWGVLTGLLRFVPYVGIVVASFSAAVVAAAIEPGWATLFLTLGLFLVVELVAGQAVEPLLYGHTTGLSPLSVVVAAIFWSWLWGPIGLLVSTPLTLCLVVAGRYVPALAFLDILLGDSPALTLAQRFYQRALAGDAHEMLADGRTYIRRRSFARYCDRVLMPALDLGTADFLAGHIGAEHQLRIRATIVTVLDQLGSEPGQGRARWRRQETVLEATSIGEALRERRMQATGRWQGPLKVPAGSVTLCVGLGGLRDELLTEVLVRVLRVAGLDARHLSLADFEGDPPPGADPRSVATLCIVSADPGEHAEGALPLAEQANRRFPSAVRLAVLLGGPPEPALRRRLEAAVDAVALSFEDASQRVQQVVDDVSGDMPELAAAPASTLSR